MPATRSQRPTTPRRRTTFVSLLVVAVGLLLLAQHRATANIALEGDAYSACGSLADLPPGGTPVGDRAAAEATGDRYLMSVYDSCQHRVAARRAEVRVERGLAAVALVAAPLSVVVRRRRATSQG